MGKLEELVKKLKKGEKKNELEETLKELEQEGNKTADKIAEKMGQNDKTAFIPKVNVPPLPPVEFELPEGCEINECGEVIRKDQKEKNVDRGER